MPRPRRAHFDLFARIMNSSILSVADQIQSLNDEGYVIVRGAVDAARCQALLEVARQQLAEGAPPVELEADLAYPGAPASRAARGGQTIRRLLDAYGRSTLYAQWATDPMLKQWMQTYFGETPVLSRVHHNCIMTKHPDFGSLTGWHRDIRYWSFAQDNLISVWLALGTESKENGGLWLVPRSHHMDFGSRDFDGAQFFQADQPQHKSLRDSAICPTLERGDLIFFHSRTLHSADRNYSANVKFSPVFAYHALSNPPTPDTRSSARPGIVLD